MRSVEESVAILVQQAILVQHCSEINESECALLKPDSLIKKEDKRGSSCKLQCLSNTKNVILRRSANFSGAL